MHTFAACVTIHTYSSSSVYNVVELVWQIRIISCPRCNMEGVALNSNTAGVYDFRWKAMALNAEVWVETVTEGGRRFMAAWRKEEVDAARHRQEKREATRLGTLLSQTGV